MACRRSTARTAGWCRPFRHPLALALNTSPPCSPPLPHPPHATPTPTHPHHLLPCRPLNRILVAQRITRPQMYVSLTIIPLHVATTYTLVHSLNMGYLGIAAAAAAANAYFVLLTGLYVAATGLSGRVWGRLSREMWRVSGEGLGGVRYRACAGQRTWDRLTWAAWGLPGPAWAAAWLAWKLRKVRC